MTSRPQPTYEELKEENQMLKQALFKMMLDHGEIPSEEEMMEHMQNPDFNGLSDLIDELRKMNDKPLAGNV